MVARALPGEPFPRNEADRMFTLLVKRAAELAHAAPGSSEEEEFEVLASAIEAYETKRWQKAFGRNQAEIAAKKKAPLGSLRRGYYKK